MKLEVKDLSFSYGKTKVLKNVSFSSSGGEAIAVLGPNGVGKSTFFKCILGFLLPTEGSVEIEGRKVCEIGRKELSSYVAYIPQSSLPVYNHTVLDSVAMGLSAKMGLFSVPGEKELSLAREALGCLYADDGGSGKQVHQVVSCGSFSEVRDVVPGTANPLNFLFEFGCSVAGEGQNVGEIFHPLVHGVFSVTIIIGAISA